MSPIIKSAKKALRQSEKRRKRNIKRKNELKRTTKEIKKLATEDKKKEALKLIPQMYKAVDKAAKRGIIKKNTANRKKSQIARFVNSQS